MEIYGLFSPHSEFCGYTELVNIFSSIEKSIDWYKHYLSKYYKADIDTTTIGNKTYIWAVYEGDCKMHPTNVSDVYYNLPESACIELLNLNPEYK